MSTNPVKSATEFLKGVAAAAEALAGALEALESAVPAAAPASTTPAAAIRQFASKWMSSEITPAGPSPAATVPTPKSIHERYLEGSANGGNVCHGVQNVMDALQMSAVEGIVVNENMDMYRCELQNCVRSRRRRYYTKSQLEAVRKETFVIDGDEYTITHDTPLVQWLKEHSADGRLGDVKVEFIPNQLPLGIDIGGVLRWKVEFGGEEKVAPKKTKSETFDEMMQKYEEERDKLDPLKDISAFEQPSLADEAEQIANAQVPNTSYGTKILLI